MQTRVKRDGPSDTSWRTLAEHWGSVHFVPPHGYDLLHIREGRSSAWPKTCRLVTADCLPREVRLGEEEPAAGPYLQVRIGSTLADVERRLILATLDDLGGKKKEAAQALGVSLKTLYNRLKAYDQDGS